MPNTSITSHSRLLALMFTDLVDSSALKAPSKLGDTGYLERVAAPHVRIFRDLLKQFPGAWEIDYTGDGFFVAFERASDAVTFALLFQQQLLARSWEGVPAPVRTRIGIHLGEVLEFKPGETEEPLMASHAADMCARLMSLGAGGQIMLSRAAFDNARQFIRSHPVTGNARAPELGWLAHGRYLFKGRDEPMEVFEVGAVGSAPLRQPPDSEKAKRSVSAEEEATLGWRPAVGLEVIGRPEWILEERLGEGGFGEVWLARQSRTKERRVFKFCFDPERVRSFKRELTLFRLLREGLGERDDMVRLFDVRLDQAPFFIESEYLSSGDLQHWLERKGGPAGLSQDERLALVARVARSVAAAHSLGIIHKDIKPSNIFMKDLPNGSYQPVLADFGIGVLAHPEVAKQHNVTVTGFTAELVGGNDSSRSHTRLYAPPEAISHRPPTVKWDIYALGVMLYQLAVGDLTRPLGEGWAEEISDPLLREDIAACVRRDLDRRLDSATALAERLETIEMRRARREAEQLSAADRQRIKRLRARLVLATAFLALTLILGTVSWIGWRRASAEELRAEKARQAAVAHAQLTLETIGHILVDAQLNLKEVAGGHKVRKALVDLAEHVRAKYQEIDKSVAADARGTGHLSATAQVQLGEVWATLGNEAEAQRSFERALQIAEPLAAKAPADNQLQLDLSVMLSRLGDVAVKMGNLKLARSYYERDLQISQRLATKSTNDVDKFNLVGSLANVAQIAQNEGDYDFAQKTFEQSLALCREIEQRHPGRPTPRRKTMAILQQLGDLGVARGAAEEATAAFERSLVIAREFLEAEPKNPENIRNAAMLCSKLGQLQAGQNQFEKASSEFQLSLSLLQPVANDDPENAQKQRDVAVTLRDLGRAAKGLSQLEHAEEYLQRSVALIQQLAARDAGNAALQRDLAVRFTDLGEVELQRTNSPRAIQYFERARGIHAKIAAANPTDSLAQDDLSTALDGLGRLALQQNDLPVARTNFQASLDILIRLYEQSRSARIQQDIAEARTQLGRVEERSGNKSAARQHFQAAQALLQTLENQKHPIAEKQVWFAEIAEALNRLR
jgi:class 3 adenylate cyclase/tetratricopeptide (TPR) repeat protein